ncbi:MAG: MBOAT family protein [Deltaproteobacteria bacterium]|jgi:alginate O-acetyltransferase complex protein AlgI|nr:MBOAT family protein [Deltaproteobacteria bacterium]
MVFASLTFIFLFLPAFLALDFLARRIGRGAARNAILLLLSLLFYTWGEGVNLILLVALGFINHYAGRSIPASRRPMLALGVFVALNLSVLFVFKYSHWMVNALHIPLGVKRLGLPLGISFFTFHAISYLVDVYRRDVAPARNPLEFLSYFCMFPHLVAGPIVRYAQIKDDLTARGPDAELFSFGLYRFLLGLNKKVIIANSVAIIVDSAFTMSKSGNLHFVDSWIGILAYAVQIYFDFSGYSDMAIGLAAMAGFRFRENFLRPYSSSSIREFWRRWHVSLSSWMRDYLYIPLGGSKGGPYATYRNLLLVFLLCGLWHGANLTFILWGLWHGVFLILERARFLRPLGGAPRPLARVYAMLVVLIGWVLFRSENVSAAWLYLSDMFGPDAKPIVLFSYGPPCVALALGILFCLVPDRLLPKPDSTNPSGFPAWVYLLQAALAVLSVSTLLGGARNPFIYFNF